MHWLLIKCSLLYQNSQQGMELVTYTHATVKISGCRIGHSVKILSILKIYVCMSDSLVCVPMPGRIKAFVCSCICFLVYQCQGELRLLYVHVYVSLCTNARES